MKIRQLGDDLFFADRQTGGQTDRRLVVAFSNFSNARGLSVLTVRAFLWNYIMTNL